MRAKGTPEAQQLESFIIKQLLKSSGAFNGSSAAGSSLTAEMFAETLSEAIAGAGGLGLSNLVERSLPSARGAPSPSGSSSLGHVTSRFGERSDPITGERSQHSGVDLAAPEGTRIPAAKEGTVISAGSRGGYGNAIEVAHSDGSSTLYAHASEVAVNPGDRVNAGDTLGWVGQTGRTTGPHLHLEVRQRGRFVDPSTVLKAYRLRDE